MLFSSKYLVGVVQLLVLPGHVFPAVYLGSNSGTVSLWPIKPLKGDFIGIQVTPTTLVLFFFSSQSNELVLTSLSFACVIFPLLMVFT